jgi:hypothetical protein
VYAGTVRFESRKVLFLRRDSIPARSECAAHEAQAIDELEQVRLLILRTEVAHPDRLIARYAHQRNAARLRALRRNPFEVEFSRRLGVGRRLLERGVCAGEAEAEEVNTLGVMVRVQVAPRL